MSMGKFVKRVGELLLAAGVLVILISYAEMFLTEDFSDFTAVINPFNIWNLIAVAIMLAPGFSLIWLGEYLMVSRERV